MPRDRDEKFAYEYHSEARVEFVRRLPCCVCGRRPSQNSHVWGDGTARKGPYVAIVPHCWSCHDRYHWIGKLALLQWCSREHGGLLWEGRRDIDSWEEIAGLVEEAWQLYENGLAY